MLIDDGAMKDDGPSICFEVSVEEFDRALHGLVQGVGDIVIVPFIDIELRSLVGFQHFVIEHLRKLPGHIVIGCAVVQLNGPVEFSNIGVR